MPEARNKGFTLIEVIILLIVIGVLSAMIVPQLILSNTDAELSAKTEVIKSHIGYAQARAMNTNRVWGIRFLGGTYSIYHDNFSGKVILPGEDSTDIVLPSGMTVTTGVLSFTTWGEPCSDEPATTMLNSATSYTVTYQGKSKVISVVQDTGYIQ